MITKQYVFTLPADYDMRIIRERVAAKAVAYDTFPGLGIKAFMIREKGPFGADANQYAPFYVWPQAAPMWDFVMGAGFAGVVAAFGWVPIQTWAVLDVRRGAHDHPPTAIRSATREDAPIVPATDLAALRGAELESQRQVLTEDPTIVARVVGVNVETWRLVRFTLFAQPLDGPPPAGSTAYEVLHFSGPGLDRLPRLEVEADR
jgi:hypothetical protein